MQHLEVNLSVFVTNVPELLTGHNLVADDYLEFVDNKLKAKKGHKMPAHAVLNKETDVYEVRLNSMFTDVFYLDEFPGLVDLLIVAKEGVMFVGKTSFCARMAKALSAGKVGTIASDIENLPFRRGYWTISLCNAADTNLVLSRVNEYILNGEAVPAEEPESEADAEPVEEPTRDPQVVDSENPDTEDEGEADESGSPSRRVDPKNLTELLAQARAGAAAAAANPSEEEDPLVADCRRECARARIVYNLGEDADAAGT